MFIAPLINHLLVREEWARQQLQAHSGKIARFDIQLQQFSLQIGADGLLSDVAADQTAAVTIRLQAADLPLMLQNPQRAFSYVKVDGDAELANTISTLSQQLRWDAEADLSKLFGDIAAVRLVAGARSVAQTALGSARKLQENLAEYLLEERPVLVRPTAVSGFAGAVSKTRDDVERLIKRIEKLERAAG